MLETKYDRMKGGWCSNEVDGHFEVGVWKKIGEGFFLFFFFFSPRFLRYEVGDGFKVWFSIARYKEAWLADLVQFSNGNH